MDSPAHFLDTLLRPGVGHWLVVSGRPTPIATDLIAAFDSRSRKRGLLGRDQMDEGAAIVLAPCQAIHTFGMRFPIDVIFAARDGRVLKIRHAMPARRVTGAARAFAVIEMAAGSAARAGLAPGDRLAVVSRTGEGTPSSR